MLQPRVGLPVGDVDLPQAANDQLKGGTDVSKQAGGKTRMYMWAVALYERRISQKICVTPYLI